MAAPILGDKARPGAALVGLAADLRRRMDSGKPPIRIGLIGSGEMGTDIVTQCAQMTGVTVAAIAEINLDAARRAIAIAGEPDERVAIADSKRAFDAAMQAGKIALTNDAQAVCTNDEIDVVIDATGKPAVGAEIGLVAMQHGKHLVMMNVEADVTIGAYLQQEARRLGVVYTLGAGDEPSSCMELINFVTGLGYPIIAAGKGKNNPLNIDATPDAYQDEAKRRNMNPRMLVEFVDGSKTMVEMAAIANATGLVPDVPGMHGPKADRDDLVKVLIPREDGGILHKRGVVDFTVGKGVAPGVFVIVEATHPRIIERMDDLHVGTGPYYSFFRPYHLTSLEVPLTAARIVLYGRPDMVPLPRPVAEVCAVAKRDLAAGKGKNNPLNIDATPDAYQDEAKRRNMNPRMLVEFVDGSKTMVEMAAIANATGLVPDRPGMHGPAAVLSELEKVLCPVADGGVLSRKGVVDYSIGKGVAPGVFVIAEMAHPRLRERMHDLKLGAGPYYKFYRPYHLTSLEVPLSCARAVLYGTPDMQPLDRPSAEVCAVAKKDLKPGDKLDAIGEYTYRAWIMRYDEARTAKAVPCGLLENGTVKKPIKRGELLDADNVAVDRDARIVALRKRQDEMLHGAK